MPTKMDETTEWLEADGLGGFAFGTVNGLRTRRYHGLLVTATKPPTQRVMLINGLDAWVETPEGRVPLTSQRYAPDVIDPAGASTLVEFTPRPWPAWRHRGPDGSEIEHDLVALRGAPLVALCWRLHGGAPGCRLCARLLVSGRDVHALHHENPSFDFRPRAGADGELRFRPYEGMPEIVVSGHDRFDADPAWYRRFHYQIEHDRGFDCEEDLASPGVLSWDLDQGAAVLLLSAGDVVVPGAPAGAGPRPRLAAVRATERDRRASFPSRLHAAADAYLVRRGEGRTIIAGYPWFTDWGRDTFIAMRGLCLATDRLDDAEQILTAWAATVSEGMVPNRFVDEGDRPEHNAVDASLWFVVAVRDFLDAAVAVTPGTRKRLLDAVGAILAGYTAGTRHGIRRDGADGLLAAGEPGVQLTWMDAKVGDWVVTPRVGKPVEIQALWINALAFAATFDERWRALLEQASHSFAGRFWNAEADCLYDVIDCDHEPGRVDAAVRPNQVFAVGGLPLVLLDRARARQVVDTVERTLLTPYGLRTLAPDDPAYRPRYEGGVLDRDGAYHQGTVWPWLMGPFVEAWVRVHGADEPGVRAEARTRFLEPLHQHLEEAGVGHISEVFDAEAPHRPGGCPMQAWSVAELLRLEHAVLAEPVEI